MVKLRKAVAYRFLERPYTRRSRYKSEAFIKASPASKIIRYDMGNPNKKFDTELNLVTTVALQIRHNAIESARQSSNRLLEKYVGKDQYWMKIRVYPHHILRENPLAAGAGADRMSTGMARPFGKAIGIAARVMEGQAVIMLRVNKQHLPMARKALVRAASKLPCRYRIVQSAVIAK